MKSINDWLNEYGESHQNPTNKLVHWICVPTIFFSLVGLLYCVKLGIHLLPNLQINLAMFVVIRVVWYYFRLSRPLAAGMTIFALLCLLLAQMIETSGLVLWQISLGLFVIAWIGQFWGHSVEGKRPSFYKDLQFLMIGPAWLMSFIYNRLGLRY